jgi:hypothetical protein
VDVHHIVPTSSGGTDDPDNLVVFCPSCHREAHRYKWPPRQQKLYRQVWIAANTSGHSLAPELDKPRASICVFVSDFRDMGTSAGFWFSEQLLNVLQRKVTLGNIEYHSKWLPHDNPKQSRKFVPLNTVLGATSREEFFEPKLKLKLYPERVLIGGGPNALDPHALFHTSTTVRGYYGWLFVVGSTYKTEQDTRVSVRAVLITREREETVFVEDIELSPSRFSISDSGIIDAAANVLGDRLARAIQEYPWWRIHADIVQAIPRLVALLSNGSSAERVEAARALGVFDTAECNVALIDALQSSPIAEVRSSCAKSLGETSRHSASAVRALLKALEDGDLETRYQSLSSLVELTHLRTEVSMRYPPDATTDESISRWRVHFFAAAPQLGFEVDVDPGQTGR